MKQPFYPVPDIVSDIIPNAIANLPKYIFTPAFESYFSAGKPNTLYAYIVMSYTSSGRTTNLITESDLQNMTVVINERIRSASGVPLSGNFIYIKFLFTFQIGSSGLSPVVFSKCDASEYKSFRDKLNNLIEGLVPNGKESNNLFNGKYLIESLQYSDVWQGCINNLNTLIGVKSVVSIFFFTLY